MEIKKIYNNADNREIDCYVLFAKYNESTGKLDKTSAHLYKDEKCTEMVTREEMMLIKDHRFVVEGKDITYYPFDTTYFDDSPVYVDVLEMDNDNAVSVVSLSTEDTTAE